VMTSLWNPFFWGLRFWRNYERQIRDMNIRQARERAALTAWQIEVEHAMREREDERRHWYGGNNAER
jgi:hypothetical protein